MPPFAAYLRVYEPLIAFERARQQHWRRYLAAGRAVPQAVGPLRQRRTVIEALGAGWTRLPELPDEAYALADGDVTLVCPWDLRMQVAQGALSAREGVPAAIADAFVPPALTATAERVVSDWRTAADPLGDQVRTGRHASGADLGHDQLLHEQVSGWSVPARWFAFVEYDERRVALAPTERHLRYRTSMARARRRAHRALAVLKRAMGATAPITAMMESDVRWLEEFHPRSVLELDYGGLVYLLGDRDLLDDDSPRIVADTLAALSRDDAQAAGELYSGLLERWRKVQLRERRN
ncbi:MAG TPA: hypothetical protein VGN37_30870 [Actinocatenispora sp.]